MDNPASPGALMRSVPVIDDQRAICDLFRESLILGAAAGLCVSIREGGNRVAVG